LVVVGEVIGEGPAQEQSVVGETPNLAARLQGLAEPDSLVIADSTRRLAGDAFTYIDLGRHSLKGFAEPVPAWQVVGLQEIETRFEATHRRALTALVGRQLELCLLIERWRAAQANEGQIVLVSGEPGIGKSRITQALRERICAEPHIRLSYQCSPYYTNSALFPVISQLERAANFAAGDSTAQKLSKLEHLLQQSTEDVDAIIPLFAALLSIPIGGRDQTLDLTPQEQKKKIQEALFEQLFGLAAHRPVLFVLEDAQWIDPSTLELIDLTVARIQTMPVLMVITFRPEFAPPWTSQAHSTELLLNRLEQGQVAALIECISGGKALPSEVLEQIVAKTDGVPLFVEELTKTVLESGLLRATDDRYELVGPLPPLAIPASLQDSLMARLDRLTPPKQVAQVGAAIGREFSYALVRALTGMGDDKLKATLAQLMAAELIFQRGQPPAAIYTFKHALVRDAAYASLLKSRRRQVHADIACVLLEKFPKQAETQPELLAYHYTEAGLAELALDAWQAAAKRAVALSAYAEALHHLDQALAQLARLPNTVARERRELELQVMKFGPLFPVKGFAARECDQTSERALALCRRVGDDETMFTALYARWVIRYVLGQQRESFDLSREYLERALTKDYELACLVGHRIHAVALLMRGDVEAACSHGRLALQRYVAERHRPLLARFGQDLKVSCLNYLALAEALAGRLDAAHAHGEEAIAYARSLNHIHTRAYALWHIGVWLPAMIRETEDLQRGGNELIDLAQEHRLLFWEVSARPFLVVAGLDIGDVTSAEEAVRALDIYRQKFNCQLCVPQHFCHISETYLAAGHMGAANRYLEMADDLMQKNTETYWKSELFRLRGKLELAYGQTRYPEAVSHMEASLALARNKGLKLLELRVATDLARLWAEHGQRNQALDLLGSVCGEFTEGFDTTDLKVAKTLLFQLG
jgi:predicted ATPase